MPYPPSHILCSYLHRSVYVHVGNSTILADMYSTRVAFLRVSACCTVSFHND